MYYVMSDVHGCYDEFEAALSNWNPNREQLVVMGDLLDRGPDSLKVIRKLMRLQAEHKDRVIVLKGNHDELFVEWALHVPAAELKFYAMPMHDVTIRSFFEDDIVRFCRFGPRERGMFLRKNFKRELNWLDNLPLYHESEHLIFVHAGINLGEVSPYDFSLNPKPVHWRDDTSAMNHIRNLFYASKKLTPKRVFFGHTTTGRIRDNDDYSVWMSDAQDKIGIDGGVSLGHQLNAVKTDAFGDIEHIHVIAATSNVRYSTPC